MFSRKLTPLFLGALVAAVLATSCSQAEEKKPATGGPSSVWRVEKDGKRIYIGGTIHLLREKDHPLPDVFQQAYADSTKLVFELPPDSDGDGEIVLRMRQMGSYGTDGELGDHVSAETLKTVHAWAAANGFPKASINRLRPWYLALTVAAIEYGKLGAEPERGVDAHFEKLAKEDGKAAEGLESVEFQLSIFSKLSDKLQEELLLQTFTEAQTAAQDFTELIGAWRSGDAPKLQEFLFRDADKYPELMEDFLFKRNRAWVKPLLKHLQNGERVFVLVGAGHLGGKEGVLELLKAKGCTVTQLGLIADEPKAKPVTAPVTIR